MYICIYYVYQISIGDSAISEMLVQPESVYIHLYSMYIISIYTLYIRHALYILYFYYTYVYIHINIYLYTHTHTHTHTHILSLSESLSQMLVQPALDSSSVGHHIGQRQVRFVKHVLDLYIYIYIYIYIYTNIYMYTHTQTR